MSDSTDHIQTGACISIHRSTSQLPRDSAYLLHIDGDDNLRNIGGNVALERSYVNGLSNLACHFGNTVMVCMAQAQDE